MKRVRGLFEQIPEWENLLLATTRALRGKRRQRDAAAFTENLEVELARLGEEIREGTYKGSGFTQFVIHDPKERIISAPAFRDRVAQHAIVNVCEPELERFLICHTYACRVGKGTLAALHAARRMAQKHEDGFWLKMDIRKYFDSVPHERLSALLERRFAEEPLLDLFRRILAGYSTTPGHGLPIGSLISQHFANFYLGHLDHEITRRMGIGNYVRYMDDFVIWHDDKAVMRDAGRQVESWLAENLDLRLKREPMLQRVRIGMDFLGFRIFPNRLVPAAATKRRVKRKLATVEREFAQGQVNERLHQQRVSAIFARLLWPEVRSRHFREGLLGLRPVGSGHRPRTG